MERLKSDMPDSSQIVASVVNGEESRQPIHRRPFGLTIRVREIDCLLADIQAQMEMLRRERTYLGLVRKELAGMKPSEGVRKTGNVLGKACLSNRAHHHLHR